jgi:hypothetical protein
MDVLTNREPGATRPAWIVSRRAIGGQAPQQVIDRKISAAIASDVKRIKADTGEPIELLPLPVHDVGHVLSAYQHKTYII